MPLPVMAMYGGQQVRNTGAAPSRRGQRVGTSTINNNQEGYTRDVSPDELVSTNLERYTSQDPSNRYIQGARGRGVQAAGSRGLGNSTLAAAAGEAAAIDAAGQFAMADATAAQRAASENLQSLGQQRISDEGNQTSTFNTMYSSDTQAGIAMGDRESRERENAFDRTHQTETDIRRRGYDVDDRDYDTQQTDRRRGEDRGWQVEDRDYGERSIQRRNREGLRASIIQNAMQNPEYWRDPQAVAGSIDYFLGEWDRWDNEGGGDGITVPGGP